MLFLGWALSYDLMTRSYRFVVCSAQGGWFTDGGRGALAAADLAEAQGLRGPDRRCHERGGARQVPDQRGHQPREPLPHLRRLVALAVSAGAGRGAGLATGVLSLWGEGGVKHLVVEDRCVACLCSE
jgi:hypothetical protein